MVFINLLSLTVTPLPPPPPPPPAISAAQLTQPENPRMALLSSISLFDPNKLKKIMKQ